MSGTIEERYLAVKQRPTGFDYMRLLLSIAVVAIHSVAVSQGLAAENAYWNSPMGWLLRQVLPMFFALSGFLVAGSLYRVPSVPRFLGLRAIRIYPALTVEVVLSAFVIGPLLTSYALGDYFADPRFMSYLWNMLGHIHFILPGVFEQNAYPALVNLQLWTVPYELYCYLVIAALAYAGIARRWQLAVVAPIALTIVYAVGRAASKNWDWTPGYNTVPGWLLVASFLYGVTLYILRGRIPYSGRVFVVCAVGSIGAACWFDYGVYVLPFFASYCTVYVGLWNPRKTGFLKGADYSYGIFLYGFVVQQTVAQVFGAGYAAWFNFSVSMPFIVLFAALSWHFVEKPALNLRKYILPKATPAPTDVAQAAVHSA
ncbi:acyltransferase family protein [Aquabacterium sp.]|uniref:acyltransferase family protein n=1 Tax=Aquabacterium sp. TaxID=1872578 RepID=UPI003BF5FB08